MHTRGRQGKLTKSVYVESNDPKNPRFKLTIKPRQASKAVRKGSTNEETIKLTGKSLAELKLSEITSDKPEQLKAELVTVEGGAKALKVTFTAGDKIEYFRGKITAKTNLEKLKELSLAVSARVSEDINAMPASLWFSQAGEKSQARPRSFSVTSLSGKAFKITKVVDPQEAVKAEAKPTDRGWVIRANMSKAPKNNQGKLILHTDSKDQPTLEVSYRIRVMGPARRGPKHRRLPGPPGMHKNLPGKDRRHGMQPGRMPFKARPKGMEKGLRIKPRPQTKVQPKPVAPAK